MSRFCLYLFIVQKIKLFSVKAEFVLDTLEQALWSRPGTQGVIHPSGRDWQYFWIGYRERLDAIIGR